MARPDTQQTHCDDSNPRCAEEMMETAVIGVTLSTPLVSPVCSSSVYEGSLFAF